MNLQNSHVPYIVPEGFPRPFGPDELDFHIYFGIFPRDKVEVVKDRYSDSLAYVDSQIARLVEHLRSNGLWEKTIFILSADTGQAFYEHGYAGHANKLYNEVMKVSLIIHAPSLKPAVDDRPAQSIDIPPSILDLLGLPPHPSFQGISLFQPSTPGRSLYLVVQTMIYQYAVVRSGFKLIYDEQEDRYLLYDQVKDSGEKIDLASSKQALVKKLAGRLHRWHREQTDYYADTERHKQEYPPVLADLDP